MVSFIVTPERVSDRPLRAGALEDVANPRLPFLYRLFASFANRLRYTRHEASFTKALIVAIVTRPARDL